MNLRAATSTNQFRRSPLFALGFLVFVAAAAYMASQYIIRNDLTTLALLGLVFIVGAFIVAMLNNWRNGLLFFLTWLLFEDFVRKYLGNNMAIYFGKDVLVAVVYLSFFLAYRRQKVQSFRPRFLLPLLLMIWFGILQIFNPASPIFWYGVMGVKIFFYYIPLLFIGYALFDSEDQLRNFFKINLMLILLIASLGIAQSIFGHTFLNPQVVADDIRLGSELYRISPITGAVVYRASSVFVSHGRFSDFLDIAWLIVLGFTGYLLLRHRSGRSLAFLVVAVTAAAAVMCGSRGVFMWTMINAIAVAVAFIWGAPWRQGETVRVLRTIQRMVLGIALGLGFLMILFPEALHSRIALYSETLSPTSSASELTHRAWNYPVTNFLGAFNYPRWPYGYGIGTTSLGTQYVARFFNAKPVGVGVESGAGTIVLEMGIVGLILWVVMAAAILISAWGVVRKLRGTPWFPLAFVIFWYAFLLLIPFTFGGIQPYEDFVMNAYLWLLLGILFRLPTLALSAQFAVDNAPTPPRRRWIR